MGAIGVDSVGAVTPVDLSDMGILLDVWPVSAVFSYIPIGADSRSSVDACTAKNRWTQGACGRGAPNCVNTLSDGMGIAGSNGGGLDFATPRQSTTSASAGAGGGNDGACVATAERTAVFYSGGCHGGGRDWVEPAIAAPSSSPTACTRRGFSGEGPTNFGQSPTALRRLAASRQRNGATWGIAEAETLGQRR